MGVKELWNLLRSENLVTHVQGDEHHTELVREVQGKVVAVDLSQWFFQANCQPELLANFSTQEGRCLKLSFERAINFLRYGCVPVGCLDGDVPPEKRKLLQKRCFDRSGYSGGGTGNYAFQQLGSLVAQLLRALGLPVMSAPGEAEALMAALEVAGLIDACATSDGDALVFGASHVYHTLKLQTMQTKQSEVVKVEMEDIRNCFRLCTGGAEALLAMALITGGDYDTSGLDSVGRNGAMRVIRHLLKGRTSDEGIITWLAEALAQKPDSALDALTKCTGCKRCKHASGLKGNSKHHSGRNPCPACTSTLAAGAGADGGATPASGPTCQLREGPCECPFHAREEERRLNKVVRLANQNQGFPARAFVAYQGYRLQRSEATRAVSKLPQERLKWLRRPDVAQAAGVLGPHLEWEPEKVRRKLLPLLLTWDAEHCGHAKAEFEPVRIVKLHGGSYGSEPQKDAWRYLMEWRRLPKGPQQDIDHDLEWLKGKGTCTPDARSLRLDVVAQHWPALLAAFHAPAPAKPPSRSQKKGLNKAEVQAMANRMQAFLTPKRKDAAPAGKAADRAPVQGRGLAGHNAAAGQPQQPATQRQEHADISTGADHLGEGNAGAEDHLAHPGKSPRPAQGLLESPSKRRCTPPASPLPAAAVSTPSDADSGPSPARLADRRQQQQQQQNSFVIDVLTPTSQHASPRALAASPAGRQAARALHFGSAEAAAGAASQKPGGLSVQHFDRQSPIQDQASPSRESEAQSESQTGLDTSSSPAFGTSPQRSAAEVIDLNTPPSSRRSRPHRLVVDLTHT